MKKKILKFMRNEEKDKVFEGNWLILKIKKIQQQITELLLFFLITEFLKEENQSKGREQIIKLYFMKSILTDRNKH